jgi:drug/metabolite transporter (DMT)-like permease
MLLLGLIGTERHQTALTFGQQTVSAGVAALAVALMPVFMALMGTVFLGERLTIAAWPGTVLSFVGIMIVSLGENGSLKWSGGIAACRISRTRHKRLLCAAETLPWALLAAPDDHDRHMARHDHQGLHLVTGQARSIQQAPVGATAAVIYLAILTWAYALSRAPASVLGNAIYLEPPVAIVVG